MRSVSRASLLTLGLHGLGALASPASLSENGVVKRQDVVQHCIDDNVDALPTTGNLYCFDSEGSDLTCDQCLGLNGNQPASQAGGARCYISEGDPNSLGQQTACPGDPAPEFNPDGSPASDVWDGNGFMDAYCAVAGSSGIFGWPSFAVCYAYTFATGYGGPAEQAMTGAKSKLGEGAEKFPRNDY